MAMHDDPFQTFREEARELLAELEESLLGLEDDPTDMDLVAAAFRSLHTIKGSGTMFDLPELVAFAHAVETVFDRLRNGELPVTPALINLALRAKDHLEALLFTPKAPGLQEIGREILTALERWAPAGTLPTVAGGPGAATRPAAAGRPAGTPRSATPGGAAPEGSAPTDGEASPPTEQEASPPTEQEASPPTADPHAQPEEPAAAPPRTFHIAFRPSRDYFRNGGNPLAIFEELRELGETVIVGVLDDLPQLAELTPDACYLRWEIRITTTSDEEILRDSFMFLPEAVTIEEISPDADGGMPSVTDSGSAAPPSVTSAGTSDSLSTRTNASSGPEAGSSPGSSAEVASHIKVPAARLDELVNLAGEFVSAHAHLLHLAERSDDRDVLAAGEALGALVRDLRELSMALQMVPVSSVVGGFRRLVRDLSEQLGKAVELDLEGGDTHIDKNVLDALKDPIMHIIRNGIDHGIESAATRRAAGKPEVGTVRITASHSGSDVILNISDDGAGIPTERLNQVALDRGLISAGHTLGEDELLQLVFHPGISTAAEATTVSGRGVGMDVVKRTVVRLGGSAGVSSTAGSGTTVSLRLPVSVSIVEGLLTQVGDTRYMVRLSHIERCLDMRSVSRLPGQDMIDFGGEALPYRDLRTIFQVDPAGEETQIVVVSTDSGRMGLLVDQVFDTHQAVVKPLGRMLHGVSGIAGTMILGDGSPAMLLDVEAL